MIFSCEDADIASSGYCDNGPLILIGYGNDETTEKASAIVQNAVSLMNSMNYLTQLRSGPVEPRPFLDTYQIKLVTHFLVDYLSVSTFCSGSTAPSFSPACAISSSKRRDVSTSN